MTTDRSHLRLVPDDRTPQERSDDRLDIERAAHPEAFERGQLPDNTDDPGYGWEVDATGKIADSHGHRSWEWAEEIPDPPDVACPRCGAPSGRFCLTSGGWITSPHAPRRKAIEQQEQLVLPGLHVVG